ncbi:MAG: biotin carboxylase N-terminal domain-containing protein [Pseudomonadota bacterium]
MLLENSFASKDLRRLTAEPETNFDAVLVANRGEIACRIIATLRALNKKSVLAAHRVDANSLAADLADEVVEIDNPTPVAAYLDIEKLIAAAKAHGADAVHPGYGFLSENAAFAEAVGQAGLKFIGPDADVIALMGDKLSARSCAEAVGAPILPSVEDTGDLDQFVNEASALTFPLLIKAAAGGGGKGMTIARTQADLRAGAELAAREAEKYFGDPRIYCERYIEKPRHIEVQVLADAHGGVVHLGERECSIQRRFQKIVEEAPAPSLNDDLRSSIHDAAIKIARHANYKNAGTVEFILSPDESFFFLEMNTRLQVEHPVTECVYNVDLVAEQIRIAEGARLAIDQSELAPKGAAIEVRICAEDPDADFMPDTGTLLTIDVPTDASIRLDTGVKAGDQVTADFDSMLAKFIVNAGDRDVAIAKLTEALSDFTLFGVTTNIGFLSRIASHENFRAGELSTGFIAENAGDLNEKPLDEAHLGLILTAGAAVHQSAVAFKTMPEPYRSLAGWRN